MKENLFLDITDGSCERKLQVIIPNNLEQYKISTGASIETKGTLKLSPKGTLELHAENLEICGSCNVTEGYPFLPRKTYSSDYIRQYLHFRPRTNKFSSLLRVRDACMLFIHEFLHSEGYINIHTPILTSNDCEGAGEVFTVYPESKKTVQEMLKPGMGPEEAYFNKKVFLTVSGQLHLEACAHGLSKVYSFGPAFRAENSRSRLHLSEFYMLEVETAFVDELKEVTLNVEKLIKNVINLINERHHEDVNICSDNLKADFNWLDKKFPTLTYEEAVDIINKNKSEFSNFSYENYFTKEMELFLVRYCGNLPTFVINWPKEDKPFYMRECSIDSSKVEAFDLLVPTVGEVVGGSLRENNFEKLKERILNINSQLDWYLEIRKYGGVPTGGYGLGFERLLQFILGIQNIKDCIPFPRWPHNCNL